MNSEAIIRSGEGEFLPLALPHLVNTQRGEFQMIHGGDFRVMFDKSERRERQKPSNWGCRWKVEVKPRGSSAAAKRRRWRTERSAREATA